MLLSIFREKLKRLNHKLYVDMKHVIYTLNPEGTSGLYLKDFNSGQIDSSVLSGDERRIADAYNSAPDEYIGWVSHGWVPEGDQFDEKGHIISKGWRTIVKHLVDRGYAKQRRAEEIFGWHRSSYDMMNFEQKMEFEKKYANSSSRI